MDFVYETDSFTQSDGGTSFQSPAFKMPQAFQSFQASDISKRFGNLSILNLNKKDKDPLSNGQESLHEMSIKRAKETLKLLDSFGTGPSSFSSSQNHQFNENEIMNKLSLITERSSGYDSSLRNSLSQLEDKIERELEKWDQTDDENASNGKFYLNSLTNKGPLGDMSRFYLRGIIEEDLIKEQSASLRKFQKPVNSINSIKNDVLNILNESTELTKSVKEAIESTKSMKEEIDILSKNKELTNVKKDLLLAFKSTFTLNQYEDHILKFGDLNDSTTAVDFFNAIKRVKEIQSNCDILLGLEDETLGLNILSNMNEILNLVKDKILHFVQRNIETIYSSNELSMSKIDSETFQKAFIYTWLNDKEGFDLVVSKLVSTRSRLVLNDFMNQLKNYSNEVNDSIDDVKKNGRLFLSSYDTNKFISDTLAYIHNIIVNEMEGTKSLLTFEFTKEFFLSEKELNSLIGRIVQSIVSCLCKPVKGSIENAIRQEAKITVLSNVSGVLDLYKSMYSKLLPTTDQNNGENENVEINHNRKLDSLLDTISSLENEIQEKTFSLINLKLKNIQAAFSDSNIIDDNTILPDWIVDWCQFIDELFQNKDVSGMEFIMGFSQIQWDQFLSLLIDNPLALINDQVKKIKGESKEDLIIWEINCIDYMISRISVIIELNSKCHELEELLNEKVTTLKSKEFNKLLHNSGLFDIFNLINMIFEIDEELFDVMYYQPIIENKMFNLDTFKNANMKLGEFLSNYINNNTLTKLMSPTIYNDVFTGSSVKFVKFYGKVLAITNEYLKDPSTGSSYKIFQWDEYSVATLLGVDEFDNEN